MFHSIASGQHRIASLLLSRRCPWDFTMPKKTTLDDRTLKALRPGTAMWRKLWQTGKGNRRLIADGVVPSLWVRVTDKGRRTFVLIKRYPGHAQPAPGAIG